MNEITQTEPTGEASITDVRHFYIDAEGNRVEIPFDLSDSETPSEGAAFIAEVAPDHEVTVH